MTRPRTTTVRWLLLLLVAAAALLGAHRARHAARGAAAAAGRPSPAASAPTLTSTRSAKPLAGPVNAAAARAALQRLPVVAQRPRRAGYQRGCAPHQACTFGAAWTDDTAAAGGHDGCDTRNDVLRRQLRNVVLRPGSRCVVAAGELDDPYTGRRIAFRRGAATSSLVQVDHVVPLALSYDLGAWRWTAAQRAAYANDESLELVAVAGTANEAKGDAGPAQWMPPNRSDWCAYDARFVTVLARYRLPITAADKQAAVRVLSHC